MYTLVLTACLAIEFSALAEAQPATHFDSPQMLRAWSFANGPEFPGAKGSMDYRPEEGHDRPGCLAVHYSFTGGGNYVQATWQLPAPTDARTLSLWIKKPDAHRITFRLLDSGGQTFQKGVEYSYPGWQHVEVDLNHWQAHFGGANDGRIKWPARALSVIVDNTAEPREGTLLLDDVELIDRAAAPTVQLKPDVHEAQGELRFSAELSNPGDIPLKGKLICEALTLTGRLGTQVAEVDLPAGAKDVRRDFDFSPGQHNFVEASFQWVVADQATKPLTIGWSRVPDAVGPARLDAESPLGCGLYLYRWRGNHVATESMNQIADLARRAGIKWTREEFQWGAIERQPGQFDFTFYDQLVDIANAHGIHVYGLLCYWAPWAKANTPEGIDAYCRWVRAVVRHYKGKIKYWEVWNEPNIHFWTGPRELYATLLDQAYTAIKAEDPDAQVLGCSTSTIDTQFIQMVMDRGARFDALTIHPYRARMNDLGYLDELRKAHELGGGRDMWLTEVGFSSQRETGWPERRQASLAARTYLLSLASGVVRDVSWYDFRNDGNDAFYNENNFGVVRSDFRPKPAYRAMATVCRTLAGMTVKEQIDVGDGAYAFRFSDGRRDVIAACAPDNARLLSFETDAEVRIIDGMDQPVTPAKHGQRLTVALDTGFPVYISAIAGFSFKPTEAPVTVTADPASVQPGETVRVKLNPASEVKHWDLPYGWSQPERTGDDPSVYLIHVPKDAAPGQIDVQIMIGEQSPLRVPVTIQVAPLLIRI